MEEIKLIISKNITQLRQAKGMTQIELAEKLNYSDKAVSKWERGESIPDVTVLAKVADMFGVTLDYLVHPHKSADSNAIKLSDTIRKRNHIFITGISILLVWLIATLTFVVVDLIPVSTAIQWFFFIYAVPVSSIVWLVFNSIWFNRKRNYLIVSILVWSILFSLHITFWYYGINIWLIYLLGIPGQIIIILWSRLKYKNNSHRHSGRIIVSKKTTQDAEGIKPEADTAQANPKI